MGNGTELIRYLKLLFGDDPLVFDFNSPFYFQFKEISFAHEILSDPQKREKYDMFGEKGLMEGGMSSGLYPFFISFKLILAPEIFQTESVFEIEILGSLFQTTCFIRQTSDNLICTISLHTFFKSNAFFQLRLVLLCVHV